MNRYKIASWLASLAFAAICMFNTGMAYADPGSGFFFDARIGQSNLNSGIYSDNDIGFSGDVAYRFGLNDKLSVGPEIGYTWLGRFDTRSSLLRNLHSAHVSGANAGLNARYSVTDTLYVIGRAGIFHSGPTATYITPQGTYATVDKNSTKEYAGVGGGAYLLGGISIGIDYTFYYVNAGSKALNPRLLASFIEFRF